ncbi:hypothetical protein GGS20DRAFT_581917 [Poronia punctata]|nr:hypothetical protein GGS20DRAFT_581917 [Poronia punctata]
MNFPPAGEPSQGNGFGFPSRAKRPFDGDGEDGKRPPPRQFEPVPIRCDVCFALIQPPAYMGHGWSCEHKHCPECIGANVRIALESNPFSPARCCSVLAMDVISKANCLSPEEYKRYADRIEELTRPEPALYCWGPNCNQYIPVTKRRKIVGECSCGLRTCKRCEKKAHWGGCDANALAEAQDEEKKLMKLGSSKNWKRCPNCRQMVQKAGGCNHVV